MQLCPSWWRLSSQHGGPWHSPPNTEKQVNSGKQAIQSLIHKTEKGKKKHRIRNWWQQRLSHQKWQHWYAILDGCVPNSGLTVDERLFLPFIGLAFQSFAPFLRFVCVKRFLLILLFCSSLSVLVSSESESLRAETERRERESRLREARGERLKVYCSVF